MPAVALPIVVCLSVLAFGQGVAGPEPVRPMLVPTYGFSVEPPPGWLASMGKASRLPIFVNAPLSKMQDLLRLPEGGAIINLLAWDSLPRRRGDESLVGWAHVDAVNAAPATIGSRVLNVPPSTGISDAILVSFDEATFGPDDQTQHEISAYWTFRGKNFAAHLFYVVGDPKAAEYEGVLKGIVLSVRPL
jgi:hypothetical protein